MNCEQRYDREENRGSGKASKSPGNARTGRRERWAAVFFTVLLVSLCAWKVSTLWSENWRAAITSGNPKSNWEHMSGNDGKFWRGTPDDSVYADMEDVRLASYYQYFYDSQGRLSKVNTFRHHSNYEDVWVLSDEETYEYDSQGRISERHAIQGNTQWTYEYTDSGYTKSCSSYPNYSKPDIYTYDLADNLIFYRNATNYRYAHGTTFEYDGQNRLVRKILEVEGNAPYVTLTIAYDEEDHTSVETEYDSHGEELYIWHNTYDENWEKTDSVWYAAKDIPEGHAPEEYADHYTRGYWVYYADGVKMAEMSNEPWKETRNNSKYIAYDYDSRGNCIMELDVYGVGFIYMNRYVYDDRDRLTEEYRYDFSGIKFWERLQADGSLLTLRADGGESMSVTRTTPDGTLINRFVYGDSEVEMQDTPAGTLCWQLSPGRYLAENEPEAKPGEGTPEQPGSKPGGEAPEPPETKPPGEPAWFAYRIEPGDCLWKIAEEFLGAGWKYMEIYQMNRGVLGDDPRLILPDTKIYIEVK